MSSNACNVGSRFLLGEGVCSPRKSPPCRRGWRLGGGKLSVDSNCLGLRQSVKVSIQWAEPSEWGKAGMAFRRAAFSSRREALTARKEANCCWWEFCCSFSCLYSYTRRWFVESSEPDGRSPINWTGSLEGIVVFPQTAPMKGIFWSFHQVIAIIVDKKKCPLYFSFLPLLYPWVGGYMFNAHNLGIYE